MSVWEQWEHCRLIWKQIRASGLYILYYFFPTKFWSWNYKKGFFWSEGVISNYFCTETWTHGYMKSLKKKKVNCKYLNCNLSQMAKDSSENHIIQCVDSDICVILSYTACTCFQFVFLVCFVFSLIFQIFTFIFTGRR